MTLCTSCAMHAITCVYEKYKFPLIPKTPVGEEKDILLGVGLSLSLSLNKNIKHA